MSRIGVIGVMIVGIGLLVGCGQPPAQVLPTLIPTLEPITQPTSTSEPTQSPTQPALVRPTLPPTWTPTPDAQSQNGGSTGSNGNPAPTDVIPATPVPTLAVCATFRDDRARNPVTFVLGTAPQVYWTKVDTAVNYRIRLIDETGAEVFADYTADTTFTLRADLFARDKRYGWEVYPRDAVGQQMCRAIGAELLPQ